MRAGGLEGDGQGLSLDGAIDNARGFQIFGEEVVPGMHLFGVDQQDGAGDIAGFGEARLISLSNINDAHVSVRRKRRSPGDGDSSQRELLWRDHNHPGCTFGPACLDGEALGVDAVGARLLETRDPPVDRHLHRGSAGDASADLVGQSLQVAFQRRRLLSFGDDPVGCVLREGSTEEEWD